MSPSLPRLRRSLAAVVTALVALTLLTPLAAHAQPFPAGYPKMGSSQDAVPGHSLIVGSTSYRTHLFPIHTQPGGGPDVFAYCIEMDVPVNYGIDLFTGPWSDFPGNNRFATDPQVRAKVAWIVRNSYPQATLAQVRSAAGISNLTAKEAIAGTQAAIWSLTDASTAGLTYAFQGVVVDGDRLTPGSSQIADRVGALVSFLTGPANSGRSETTGPALSVTAADGQAGNPVGPIRIDSTEPTATITLDSAYPLITSNGAPVNLGAAPTNTDLFLNVPADAPAGSATITATITGPGSTGLLVYNTAPRTQTLMIAISEDSTLTDSAALSWRAIPEIRTQAIDQEDGDSYLTPTDEATIIDTVTYTNLIPGTEYTISGELMIREPDGQPTPTGITAETTFTPPESHGTIDLHFTIPHGLLTGKVIVAYEHLYTDGIELATHTDITDENQTVYRPAIDTYAYEIITKGKLLPAHGGTLRDEVTYRGLKIGDTYTLRGEVMLHDTGETTGITAETTFTAETSNGIEYIDFEIPETYASKTLVVFERLYLTPGDADTELPSTMTRTSAATELLLATHEDLDDEKQTVTVSDTPIISTSAIDQEDGDSYLTPTDEATIIDTVTYTNLIPGTEYTISGELMIREPDGQPTPTGITAETTFTPPESHGTIDLHFTIPHGLLTGKVIVAYEHLYTDGIELATHTDITDENQTVYRPRLETDAYSFEDPEADLPSTGGILQDRVSYWGLQVGETYTVTGELMDQATGEPTGITGKTTFTATTQDGSVLVDFIVTSDYAGRTLVVFERLYLGNLLLAAHEDLDDDRQTVGVEVPPVEPPATPPSDEPPTVTPPPPPPALPPTGVEGAIGLAGLGFIVMGALALAASRRLRY